MGADAMTTGWYSTKRGAPAGEQSGPFTWEELYALAQSGVFAPDDLVWHPQSPQWTAAAQIPGLLATAFSASPAGPRAPATLPAATPAVGPAASPAGPPPLPLWARNAAPPPLPARAQAATPLTPPAAPAPPARPALRPRARPRKVLIALVCLAIAVVAAGAAVGTYFAARGPGQPGEGQAIAVEKLHLQGTVLLPDGAALAPKDLVMLSNSAEDACSASGTFDMTALHDSGARTVLLALNSKRNPVLMAITEADTVDLQPSVASTARTLVLFDPAFLSLPKSAYTAAAQGLESDPRLAQLESTLAGALRSDPDTPLDADAHPDIYELAAQIAADLLSGIIQVDEAAAEQPATQASLATMTGGLRASPVRLTSRPATLLAAGGPSGAATASAPATPASNFVDVIDDSEHSTSEVALVNTTFATYLVDWTLTTPKGTTTAWTLLPRCAPWRVDETSLQVGFPPVGFRLEKPVQAGNGQLTFKFQRNDDYMGVDIALNMCTLAIGFGSEAMRKVAGGGRDIATATNITGGVLLLSKELGALGSRLQGQSYAGCAKEVAAYFAVNWGRVVIAAWPLIETELKEEFPLVLGMVITRRMAAMAVLGYGSFDLIMQLRAWGDPTIAAWSTQGIQLANVYPFAATLKLTASPRNAQTYVFEALIRNLPVDFRQPLELEMDFGDGNTETVQPNVEAGAIPVSFLHTYSGTLPKTVRAVLRTYSVSPMILASQDADMPVNVFPTLDEIVGSYPDATMTLQDVHVAQAVWLALDDLRAQGDTGADNYKQNITALQARKGQSVPLPFDITKTGSGAGVLAGPGGNYDFTYADGVITIKMELKNADGRTYSSNLGTLNAKFDKSRKVVISGTITEVSDGFYTSSQHYFPPNSFYLVKQLTASKPASQVS